MNDLNVYDAGPSSESFNKVEFVEGIAFDIADKIDGYIATHGSTGGPVPMDVDMLKFKSKVRPLLTSYFDRIVPSLSRFQQVTDFFLDAKEIELSSLSPDQLDSLDDDSGEDKDRARTLLRSLDLMFLMIVLVKLSDIIEEEDKGLSNSCRSLAGFVMMVLADFNYGLIPERFIKVLQLSGFNISRVDEEDIDRLKDKGISVEDLEMQRELRQAYLSGPAVRTIQ
jgi:hypothetical protein